MVPITGFEWLMVQLDNHLMCKSLAPLEDMQFGHNFTVIALNVLRTGTEGEDHEMFGRRRNQFQTILL